MESDLRVRVSKRGIVLLTLGVVYAVTSILLNLATMAFIDLKFLGAIGEGDFGPIYVQATAGTILAALMMVISDVIAETFTKKETVWTLLLGYLAGLVMSILIITLSRLNLGYPVEADGTLTVFDALMPSVRIFIGGLVAFIFGTGSNLLIMWFLKYKDDSKDKGKFKWRAWVSTLIGQTLDNATFFLIAFAPFVLAIEPTSLFSNANLDINYAQSWSEAWKLWVCLFLAETTIEIIIETALLPLTHKLTDRIKPIMWISEVGLIPAMEENSTTVE